MLHDDGSSPPDRQSAGQDNRTHRACTEDMSIRALLDGRYLVHAQSGRTYLVNLTEDACTCPDPHDECKHLRRVKLDIACGELLHPDECPSDADLAAREPFRDSPLPTSPSTTVADGGQAIETDHENETAPPFDAICRVIDTRIQDHEHDIKSMKTELDDYQKALSVLEDVSDTDTTSDAICRVISDRVRDLEREIDCTRGELNNYRIAFSVIEDVTNGMAIIR